MLKIIVRLGDGWEHVGTHIFWFPFSRWFAAFVLEKRISFKSKPPIRHAVVSDMSSIWAVFGQLTSEH